MHYILSITNLKYPWPIIERFLTAGAFITSEIHLHAYVSEYFKVENGVLIDDGDSIVGVSTSNSVYYVIGIGV